MHPLSRTAAVVGAGLGGLSAAWRLRQAGWSVSLFESSDRAGGRVQTLARDGFLIDTGASAIADSYTAYLQLAAELGLSDAIVPASPCVGIYRDGRLHELPLDRPLRLARTPLLSSRAKLRAVRLALDVAVARLRGQLDYSDMTRAVPLDTESASDYARRALNPELEQYLVSPITRVMLIADPERISKVELFSGLANIMSSRIACLRGGQGLLPTLLADKLAPRYRHAVQQVRQNGSGVELVYRDPDAREHSKQFDACVVACPLPAALRICPDQHALLAPLDRELSYTQCITVALAFKRRPASQAFLVQMPSKEDSEIALIFLDHRKSDDRAPPGQALLDCHWEADAAASRMDAPDADIVQRTLATVYRVFPELRDALVFSHVTRWPLALPRTAPGVYRRIAAFNAAIDPASNIQFASDYMSAAGQNTVIELGRRAAANLIGSHKA